MWYYIRYAILWVCLVSILSYWSASLEASLLIILVILGFTLNEIYDCANRWLFKNS